MTGRQNHNKRVAVLRTLERSGLSMAEFCRRKGLSYGTVAAWRSTARRRRVRFIEIQPEPPVMSVDAVGSKESGLQGVWPLAAPWSSLIEDV